MKVIILGSGRVGAAIAHDLLSRGHQVTVVDRDPDSLQRLGGDDFNGDFFVGEGLDTELLERSGIAGADAFIASTDDDNTNLVIAQVAQRRHHVANVIVRVFDPDKAEFYSRRGLRVVCPTVRAIDEMVDAVERGASPQPEHDENHDDATNVAESIVSRVLPLEGDN
ncbi:MAG: TrkA family potassium uptake protein [Thermoleophilia bacterium]|nr:TrkA family potassium uptake protein [Thermoleophilia bacterium]